MNVQDHPNLQEYLTAHLMSLRKRVLANGTETFEVTVRDEPLDEDERAMLR